MSLSGLSGLSGLGLSGGAGAWSPADLPGLAATLLPAMMRSSGLLWQDAAGTTPAAEDGDPVARAECPFTGTVWTNAEGSVRPLLWDEGGGLWSLFFDGVDDYLKVSSHPFGTGDTTWAVLSAILPDSASAVLTVWVMGNYGTGLNGAGLFASTPTAGLWTVGYAGGNNYSASSAVTAAYQQISASKAPGAINTTTTVRRDGVVATDAGSSSTSTPATAAGPLMVGTYPINGAVGDSYFSGRQSGHLFATAIPTGADLTAAESYLTATY